jgi:hypothetical protein
MAFCIGRIKGSHNAERLGCPDCGLWFYSGTRQRGNTATVAVLPDDLAKHKKSFKVRTSAHESYEVAV